MGMSASHRSVATLRAQELVGSIDLDALVRRAPEFTIDVHPHFGDVAGVAAEVQRLGFAIERVQQR
jgi:hypothetical protein